MKKCTRAKEENRNKDKANREVARDKKRHRETRIKKRHGETTRDKARRQDSARPMDTDALRNPAVSLGKFLCEGRRGFGEHQM